MPSIKRTAFNNQFEDGLDDPLDFDSMTPHQLISLVRTQDEELHPDDDQIRGRLLKRFGKARLIQCWVDPQTLGRIEKVVGHRGFDSRYPSLSNFIRYALLITVRQSEHDFTSGYLDGLNAFSDRVNASMAMVDTVMDNASLVDRFKEARHKCRNDRIALQQLHDAALQLVAEEHISPFIKSRLLKIDWEPDDD